MYQQLYVCASAERACLRRGPVQEKHAKHIPTGRREREIEREEEGREKRERGERRGEVMIQDKREWKMRA